MRFVAKWILFGIVGILAAILLRFTMIMSLPYPTFSGVVLPETSAIAKSTLVGSAQNLNFFEKLASFDLERMQNASVAEVRARAQDFFSTGLALGMEPETLAAELIPSTNHIVAMLTNGNDSKDFSQIDGVSLPAKLVYEKIAALNPLMTSIRPQFEAIFESAYTALKENSHNASFTEFKAQSEPWKGSIMLPGQFSLPRLSDLDYSHTYALDIFFRDVQYLPGDIQCGPVIYSMSDGIVIASETGWIGFPRKSEGLSFLAGGISPKSGNGIIIYSPTERKYYSYFHLYNSFVRKGQLVYAGQPLGHGGNSGINARKKGRGEHLHFEVFDANAGKFLRNTQLIALLKARIKQHAAVPQE